ncbi:MAG: Fic family protein [Saprospiraceae bacterium]|jgi:Fic family protein|nr:Fic family protein [Saprospiraceae bacterium]HRO07513.1 Fic family protein [Saprospiraceae bacterium]HRP40796.1 Fic family protein [Saprospiraceae bacterium]
MLDIPKILSLIEEYNSLNLKEVLNHEKFSLYAITHHSTFIEGSTLTEIETRLLLDEGLTPKGKPLVHSLMTKDHSNALNFVLAGAKSKRTVDENFIKEINAQVLQNTGAIYNSILGKVDSSKGEYRLNNVSAGGRYFVNYAKVPKLINELVLGVQLRLENVQSIEDQLMLSFDAHFDLVSIHPFYDGNGRTSRLFMNFIQAYFNLPLALVFKEDKAEYFEALEASRDNEDLSYFRNFMCAHYQKYLKSEINNFRNSMKETPVKGKGFSIIF